MVKLNELTNKLEDLEIKVSTIDDNYFEAEELELDLTLAMDEVLKVVAKIKELGNQKRTDTLSADLKKADALINDSSHIIELVDFNASEGFRAYKLHQKLCRKRRKIKNAMNHQRTIRKFAENNKAVLGVLQQFRNGLADSSPQKDVCYIFKNLDDLEEFKELDTNKLESFGVYSRK